MYRIIHHKVWDDGRAEYNEYWTLHKLASTFFPRRRPVWKPVEENYGGYSIPVRYHSKETAERAAEHYRINIEEA